MTFLSPWYLLGLALIPILFWIHRNGISGVSMRQRRFALAVRIAMVTAATLALAGASIPLPERTPATVFVIDHSDSVPPSARAEARRFVSRALDNMPEDAMAGVVVAAAEPRVELSVQHNPELRSIGSTPDSSRTDLSRALRLAAAILPEGMRRRIVVLSDGRQNSGDARTDAQRLRRQGIQVDTVMVAGQGGPDIAVSQVSAPARARVGEQFQLRVDLAANSEMPGARLIVRKGPDVVDERTVDLGPDPHRVTIDQTAAVPGSAGYQVEVAHDRDSVVQNDVGSALVVVSGPPRVLLLEGEPGEAALLGRALADRGISAERRAVSAFPTTNEMAGLDSIVLVDVDTESLLGTQMETLAGFVRDMGRGVVAVGGESSWSLGGYRGTLLEELLPVTSEIKDPKRRPSIAQAVVLDTSGSMGETSTGSGKIEIAKAAGIRAAEALSEEDRFGVLAFNTTSRWVVPLAKLPPRQTIREKVGALAAEGGTDIPQAISEATERLKKSSAALKHIVLLSDGFNGAGDLLAAAGQAKKEGITLSVVGTGESAAQELANIADAGGGRFYPGRDLSQIPEIVMNEVVIAARKYINEGIFHPVVKGDSPATRALKSAPPLLGYIGTTAKSSASTLLSIGKYDDPLLATWRTGLGVASAWTSDAKARWSANWINWEGFADFWSNVVRETLPAAATPGFSSRATASQGGIDLVVESESPIPEGIKGSARVVGPDGAASQVELKRTGLYSFGADFSSGQTGGHLVLMELSSGAAVIYRDSIGVVRSYSPEYAPGSADRRIMAELSSITGGTAGVRPEATFREGSASGRRAADISFELMLAAAFLLLADIALRRLVLSRQDLAKVVAWKPAKARVPQGRSETMERLFRAKHRVGRERSIPRATATEPTTLKEVGGNGAVVHPNEDTEPATVPLEPSVARRSATQNHPEDPPAESSGAAELLRRKRLRRPPGS